MNPDNPLREVLLFFEIGTELTRTKVYDFGRTESNEKTTRPWTQESREFKMFRANGRGGDSGSQLPNAPKEQLG